MIVVRVSSRFVPPTRNGRQLLNNNNAVGAETSALEAEEEEAAIATASLVIGNNNNNNNNNVEAAEEVDDTIQSNIKDHHLVATLTTVICTHKDCNCKIAARGGLHSNEILCVWYGFGRCDRANPYQIHTAYQIHSHIHIWYLYLYFSTIRLKLLANSMPNP